MARKMKPSKPQKPADPMFETTTKRQPKPPYVLQPIGFKTKKQQVYFNTINENIITISTGVAGTGKTFIAVYAALQALAAGEVEKIVMTKPIVEVGESMGFLPGDMEEKMGPYIRSIEDCVRSIIGDAGLNNLYTRKKLEIIPMNFMRGLTLENCFVIADEMQNASREQTKALLTRIGEDAIYVLNGDVEQSDLRGKSGLPVAYEILKNIDGVGLVNFEIDDIVRSDILKDIIVAYHEYDKQNRKD